VPDTIDALILDLLTWLETRPCTYEEVMAAWRTSCPRLTVWEDANDRGFVARRHVESGVTIIDVTDEGRAFLAHHRPTLDRDARAASSGVTPPG